MPNFSLVGFLLGLLVFTLGLNVLMMDPAHAASKNNSAAMQVVIEAPPPQVLRAASQAFQEWDRGELASVSEEAMQVKGLSRTRFFKFVDDITVNLAAVEGDPQKTQVQIQSVGRMGEYDFGGNQRNIDEYLAKLRGLLPAG
ncbi:MAG: DUF1499 domain-containing protein [Cyanobacteriota bacterium]|nr:DUF1499 domain-containing protein [Cyanobacteriota bacterium]